VISISNRGCPRQNRSFRDSDKNGKIPLKGAADKLIVAEFGATGFFPGIPGVSLLQDCWFHGILKIFIFMGESRRRP
jgi:hypothetical protein